jgi:SulP family sulfate permease
MVIAITAGILLAAVLFMKETAEMTRAVEITHDKHVFPEALPQKWRVFKITGPLFFAAADKIFSELTLYCEKDKGVIVYLGGVNLLDAGGVAALNKLISHCGKTQAQLVLTDLQFQPLKSLAKSRVVPIDGVFRLYPTIELASQSLDKDFPTL